MVTFQSLPIDILIQIINRLDSNSQLTLGVASKFLSAICIKQLWHTPVCNSTKSLKSILTTLNKVDSNFFPYSTWMFGLDISFETIKKLPDSLISLLKNSVPVSLRTLRLNNLDGNCYYLFHVFIQPLVLQSLELSNCSADVIISLTTCLSLLSNIEKLTIKDSYLSDPLIKQMVPFVPQLRYFRSEGSGYISDTSILAITSTCSMIETIIITLPNYLVQSNTITCVSLEALATCTHLTTFICKGQVRISNEESKQWLLQHCPTLNYCDLSF